MCARPAIAVPTAEKAVPMTPKIALMRPWKTAMMEPRAAVMVWMMPPIKFPMESKKEGMFVYCYESVK